MTDLRFGRYKEAYLAMVKRAKYRPGAPSDGICHVLLSAEELRDRKILDREADRYALDFLNQDKNMEYPIGCPDFGYNKAFFYTLEAARLMCGMPVVSKRPALELLKMAIEEIEKRK